jgi:hypothetical protein
MYWPIGTPRIYATSTAHVPSNPSLVVSHDGLPTTTTATASTPDAISLSSLESITTTTKEHNPSEPETNTHDAAVPLTPGLPTPIPATPGINSVDHDTFHDDHYFAGSDRDHDRTVVPTGEPILALKVSRTGHLFATITASTMTIWQTKVCTSTGFVAPGVRLC